MSPCMNRVHLAVCLRMSTALTNGIMVTVKSEYIPERSSLSSRQYAFAYTVRIENQGEETAQLRSRHWIITDGNGSVQEVRGDGVVGAQPVLRPGENFEYTSWCVLATPSGMMRGTYQMVTDRGQSFDADIAPFRLALPQTLN
jgi:ApaG protein